MRAKEWCWILGTLLGFTVVLTVWLTFSLKSARGELRAAREVRKNANDILRDAAERASQMLHDARIESGKMLAAANFQRELRDRYPPNYRPAENRQWYVGGTLHKKTLADWHAASRRNRLATCADFVMKLGGYQSIPPDLRARAAALEMCISTATKDVEIDDKSVSEIAAVCGIALGY